MAAAAGVVVGGGDGSIVAGGVEPPQAVARSAMARKQGGILANPSFRLVSGNPLPLFIRRLLNLHKPTCFGKKGANRHPHIMHFRANHANDGRKMLRVYAVHRTFQPAHRPIREWVVRSIGE